MLNNVKPITPKYVMETYRGRTYILQFLPTSKRVRWTIPWTVLGTTIHFNSENATFANARRRARHKVDELLDGR